MKKYTIVLLASLLLITGSSSIKAYQEPVFPSCNQPSGELKVGSESGFHAIVGESFLREGVDSVYWQTDGNAVQCFCSDSSSLGIQTNWWKFDELSQKEFDTLYNLGWQYIPNGADWGLSPAGYLAINSNYVCSDSESGGGNNNGGGAEAPVCTAERPSAPSLISIKRNGSKAVLTWKEVDLATHYTIAYGTRVGDYPYGVPNTGDQTTYTVEELDPGKNYYFIVYAVNDCMPSEPSNSTSVGNTVLGLAATGGMYVFYLSLILGFVLLGVGKLLQSKIDNN